jgi:molybdopterin molybdotransferase
VAAEITVFEARRRVLAAAAQLDQETAEVARALDRVLAADIRATADIPAFPCSAMDGYAVTAGPADRRLALIGESRAGTPFPVRLETGQAVRISTGASVPAGADAVVRQEDTHRDGDVVVADVAAESGANIRRPGEDMRAGERLLAAGGRLDPAALAVAVAAGVGTVAVTRRPRVAILCTGDELRAPGEPLGPGQIHNSNGPMLTAQAERCGGEPSEALRLPDDPDATESALRTALERSDVVLISGGVSVGPHDHVRPALDRIGVEQRFGSVAMRPGRPTWFGVRAPTLVFALPGNPVSAAVAFSLFAAPALAALQGLPAAATDLRAAELAIPVRCHPHRAQALLSRCEHRGAMLLARPCPRQGSHVLTALLDATSLALIPSGEGELPAGSPIQLAELVR